MCFDSFKKHSNGGDLFKWRFNTSQHKVSLCFYDVLPRGEGPVLNHCRIREGLGLLGDDISLRPCQSIG